MAAKTVDEYIATLDEDRAQVVSALRKVVLKAAPEAEEAIKWSQPVYSSNGPCIYIRAFKNYVNIGFWRGSELDDPGGLLEGTGDKMRHIKIASASEVTPATLIPYIKEAVQLNAKQGDPARRS